MNEFRTVISPAPGGLQMSQKHRFLTLGSCFSDAMGSRLQENKFSSSINPFGIIYNPISLHRALEYAVTQNAPPPHTYLRQDEVYLNYDFHSSVSSIKEAELFTQVRQIINGVHAWLSRCDFVLLTYGTAWVYELKSEKHVVANCHKMPSKFFGKRLLTTDEIVGSFDAVHHQLVTLNPDIRIILTVSPVRHLKDTLPMNAVSKAMLRTACHELAEKFAHVEYFPAYEIMMDDLRDYRFYKSDMIHPTEQAEEYIWNAFIDQYMDEPAREFIIIWKKIQAALHHKPFHAETSRHKNFLHDTLRKLEELQSIVNVDAEIKAIKEQLDGHTT